MVPHYLFYIIMTTFDTLLRIPFQNYPRSFVNFKHNFSQKARNKIEIIFY
jgi:hypothetical protein